MTELYGNFERLQFDRPATGVLRIVLTSPHKLNSMDERLHRELAQIWPIVDADPSVAAIILTGTGEHFSAGGNISHELEVQNSYALRVKTMEEARAIVLGMAACSKPIISAVRGWAVGAGLACALMADVPIASRTAKFSDGHVKIGIAAGDHAAIIWPLLCGLAKAKYYLLTGRPLNGEEAERIGLVALVVDDAELESTALDVAGNLANGAQSAIRWTKRALNLWLKQFEAVFEASLAYEFLGFPGPEAVEGMQAFVEKRTAAFPKPSDA